MIDASNNIADRVSRAPRVQRAVVDDWGNFGNFRLFVFLERGPDVDLRAIRRSLVAAVKEHACIGAHLRTVVMPKRRYSRGFGTVSEFSGWSNDGRAPHEEGEISIDLDFIAYCPASNSFPSVQPGGAFRFG